MKIGLLGGTFDPPHLGHISLAHAARTTFGLDEVMMVPAQRNPEKKGQDQSGANQRIEMLQMAISGEPQISYTDIEIVRGGLSYAVDTLTELTFAQPADYWFIAGADSVRTIATWKQPERLVKLCRLGVALRSKHSREDLLARIPVWVQAHIDWIDMEPMDISSRDIRQRMVEGKPVAQWLNPNVYNYIVKNKMYRS